MKRVAVIIGTRPDVIKLAPVIGALRDAAELEPYVIASGQHHELLLGASEALAVSADVSLAVMEENQSLAALAARLLPALDGALAAASPDFVLVQGDTSTMLYGALAAFYRRIPIGHVEAGLRTGDLGAPFPEEANRRLVTPLASLQFAPTERARLNLLAEGVPEQQVVLTGNTIVDALQAEARRQSAPNVERELDASLAAALGPDRAGSPIVLLTVHRRESLGAVLEGILGAVADLARRHPDHTFCLPVHPNPSVRQVVFERLAGHHNVRLMEPLGYDRFVHLLRRSTLVMTDSGGVQEEAPVFGKPVVVMRRTTERPEGVEAGVAVLAGVEPADITTTVSGLLGDSDAYRRMSRAISPYGDGHAAAHIVAAVAQYLRAG